MSHCCPNENLELTLGILGLYLGSIIINNWLRDPTEKEKIEKIIKDTKKAILIDLNKSREPSDKTVRAGFDDSTDTPKDKPIFRFNTVNQRTVLTDPATPPEDPFIPGEIASLDFDFPLTSQSAQFISSISSVFITSIIGLFILNETFGMSISIAAAQTLVGSLRDLRINDYIDGDISLDGLTSGGDITLDEVRNNIDDQLELIKTVVDETDIDDDEVFIIDNNKLKQNIEDDMNKDLTSIKLISVPRYGKAKQLFAQQLKPPRPRMRVRLTSNIGLDIKNKLNEISQEVNSLPPNIRTTEEITLKRNYLRKLKEELSDVELLEAEYNKTRVRSINTIAFLLSDGRYGETTGVINRLIKKLERTLNSNRLKKTPDSSKKFEIINKMTQDLIRLKILIEKLRKIRDIYKKAAIEEKNNYIKKTYKTGWEKNLIKLLQKLRSLKLVVPKDKNEIEKVERRINRLLKNITEKRQRKLITNKSNRTKLQNKNKKQETTEEERKNNEKKIRRLTELIEAEENRQQTNYNLRIIIYNRIINDEILNSYRELIIAYESQENELMFSPLENINQSVINFTGIRAIQLIRQSNVINEIKQLIIAIIGTDVENILSQIKKIVN